MDEMRDNLKKMGWDDNLINHYLGKEFQTIKESTSSELKPQFCESNEIIINGKHEDSVSNIYINK